LPHRRRLNKNSVKERPNKEGESKKKRTGEKKKSAKEKEESSKKRKRTAEEETSNVEKMTNAIEEKPNEGKMKQERGEMQNKQRQQNELRQLSIPSLQEEAFKCQTIKCQFRLTKEFTVAKKHDSCSTIDSTLLKCILRTAKVTSRVMVKDLRSSLLSTLDPFGSHPTESSPLTMLLVATLRNGTSLPGTTKAKRGCYTLKIATEKSSLIAGNGGIRALTLHLLPGPSSFASSVTMAIGSAVKWASSDCTRRREQ